MFDLETDIKPTDNVKDIDEIGKDQNQVLDALIKQVKQKINRKGKTMTYAGIIAIENMITSRILPLEEKIKTLELQVEIFEKRMLDAEHFIVENWKKTHSF